MYGIIDKKPIFGKLNNIDRALMDENDFNESNYQQTDKPEGQSHTNNNNNHKDNSVMSDEEKDLTKLNDKNIKTNKNSDNNLLGHKSIKNSRHVSKNNLTHVPSRRPTNPNQYENNTNPQFIDEFDEEYYGDEIINYNVGP